MPGLAVALSSAKGGVGRSLLAANLALALAVDGRRTVLVDLAPACEAVLAMYLDLRPERTWGELLPVLAELEGRHLEMVLTPHPGQPLHLLAAPKGGGPRAVFPPEGVARLLELMRARFDAVVVDLPTVAHGLTLEVLKWVDVPLLVVTPDLPAVQNTRCWLENVGRAARGVHILLNQHSRRAPMDPPEVEAYLGVPLLAVLPFDAHAAWQTVGLGWPFVTRSRRGLAAAVRRLAQRLVQMPQAASS